MRRGVDLPGSAAATPQNFAVSAINFLPATVDNPNSADWAVNAFASIEQDNVNVGIIVAAFDDTAEEGIGFSRTIPAGATTSIWRFKGKAKTAPGGAVTVLPRLYRRTIGDNVAVTAWSAAFAFAALAIPANTLTQYDTETVTLAALSLTAGNLVQFQLTRNPADTLTGDWFLENLELEFQ